MTRYDDTIYIAGLQSLYNVGATHVRRFIEDFGSPYDAWEAVKRVENLKPYTHISNTDKRAIASSAKDEKLDYIIHKIDEYKMDVTTFLDKDFPSILNHIYNPPAILFMRGNRALLDKRLNRIALVGARRCSLYGRNVARMLGKELGKYSTIIVSGGARGIDTHGHEGLLSSQGYGIVVMGCGLDIVYPRENTKLFDRILQNNGLLLSEYPPGTPPSAKHFPARNRIISGLSRGVIVVEAKASSGSLITADMAVSEGRDVFVVPCNLLDHTADGNKFLMRNGAFVLTGYEDIVKEYHLTLRDMFSAKEKLSPPNKRDTMGVKDSNQIVNHGQGVDTQGLSMLSFNLDRSLILSEIPHDRCITVSDILKATSIPLQQLQPLLLELEMEGAIENHPPRGYINMTRSDILVH
ncbi:DNA-processing protein DprA [Veillonella sp.]|uniref:DNA-processing protein DprA n=1 Tax=Veillonella sp. TaxID=1926307 RepID=UPI0012BA5AD2|nr:DNA-processing protein DprA [Veillonella sp.]MBS6326484.1 DNA-processing protein DprA [Veillonella sp.]MDU2300744.1 DNA-processing protein DprA [Veillonella sp.]MDU2387590.1 DNA-processing protein DprA [Veillonella sp.]MTH31120.1 DNA-protecting protein DprA [Veillonella dispar]